jgi:hypothetical protein
VQHIAQTTAFLQLTAANSRAAASSLKTASPNSVAGYPPLNQYIAFKRCAHRATWRCLFRLANFSRVSGASLMDRKSNLLLALTVAASPAAPLAIAEEPTVDLKARAVVLVGEYGAPGEAGVFQPVEVRLG